MVRSNALFNNPHAVLTVLGDIEKRSQQPHLAGKRQFIRKSLRGEAILQTVQEASIEVANLRVQLRDISIAGLGFLTNEPVEVGTIWRVLFVNHHYVVGQQTIIVRHCRAVTPGVFLCGAQYAMDPGLLQTIGIDPESLCEGDNDLFVDSNNA